MGNKEYVEDRLKLLGIKRLTPEQKAVLQEQRDDFLKRKAEVIREQERVRRLEKELRASRPSTEGAHYVHAGPDGCRLKTAYKLGTDTGDEDVYYCAFCDRDFQISLSHDLLVSDFS
jgi:hypothetical protein